MEKPLLGKAVMEALAVGRPRGNLVISLLTAGEDGYPNVCLLSPYQVVAVDRHAVLLAVYEGSRTSANLARRKGATLVIYLPPAAYYIKGSVDPVPPGRNTDALGNVLYQMSVQSVTRDYYAKAPITSAVTFDKRKVLPDYALVYRALAETAAKMPGSRV
ncbi:MAG: hypothetical protein JRM80_05785 [Nitrososphaerota archaeon]|nr:hypothetical protein [Nitrososphaerota archaeon]